MDFYNITKEDRHQIYKKALEYINTKRHNFVCTAIWSACELFVHGDIHPNFFNETMLPQFAEFTKHRPSNISADELFSYWWNPMDTDIRVKILTECIELTKPE